MQRARPAVFVDRDGTLVLERDFLTRPDELELIPGAAAALRRLAAAGFLLVVITNQSGVARGYLSEEELADITAALDALLEAEQVALAGSYYCPHHPSEGTAPYLQDCDCRKPKPGLLHEAARDLSIDLSRSYMIGDSERDLVAGEAAGARSILVATGKGREQHARMLGAGRAPRHYAEDLSSAAELILSGLSRS